MRKINKYYTSLVIFFFIAVFVGVLPSVNFLKNIHLFVVKSGSMKPAIYPGSLIVVKKEADYFKGDVITFLNLDQGAKELITTTHRVQSVLEDGGLLAFMTKGDANDFSDQKMVKRESIIGKTVIVLPLVGYLSDLIKSKIGLIIFILIPGILIISHELFLILIYLVKGF